jgi:hypothetical protein
MMKPTVFPRATPAALVQQSSEQNLRMQIPPGPTGVYRWAQFDDYMQLPRRSFLWKAPLSLSLQARCTAAELLGTWGFGFWNDPFNANLGIGGTARRLPTLPNAAWFFYAAPPNHLAFHDTIPAQGFLAATFYSPQLPPALLALTLPFTPLLALPPAARILRKAIAMLVKQAAINIQTDVTIWHEFHVDWHPDRTRFYMDQQIILDTPITPRGRLGLVLWIDNQFAAFPPDGRLSFGTLPTLHKTTLDIKNLSITKC